MNTEPTLRPALELQRAHDTLVFVLETPELREAIFGSESSAKLAMAATDVLCWCLRHEHNPEFAADLAWIEAVMLMHGYEMKDSGELRLRHE